MSTTLPSYDELVELPNICLAQAEDLRYDDGEIRIWTSRMTQADGALFEHTVDVERLLDGTWKLIGRYDGDHPPEIVGTMAGNVQGRHVDLSIMNRIWH